MTDADFLSHEPCEVCGSSDAKGVYDDGHGHCFSCGTHFPARYNPQPNRERTKLSKTLIEPGEARSLNKRALTQQTCEKWGYTVSRYNGRDCQVANYRTPGGQLVAQKVRFPDKDFVFLGEPKKAGLYGQHLWKSGGKKVVVTEGEIDALSVSQMQGNKWPVVSVPNGAQGAAASVRDQFEWLEQFEEVVFCFDQDEPGTKAASECAEMLSPGKAKVMKLPLKDANEMLVAGRGDELIQAMWQAPVYRPDGIIAGEDLSVEDLTQRPAKGYELPYPGLNHTIHGLRKGELTLFSAGTGVGKTTMVREVAYNLVTQHNLKIGNIFLEESYQKTAQGYLAIHHNTPLGELRENPERLDKETAQQTLAEVVHGRMFFYNHFGSLESENLIRKLRYMAVGLGVDFIVLDHISMVVSGQEGSGQGERKDIDILMTALRSLVENTGVGVLAVVHLKQPEGKPHEEGGHVRLSELRGSGSLKQTPDTIVALERDQQGDEPDVARIRVLKNREFGVTGSAGTVKYDRQTGRLNHHAEDGGEEGDKSSPFEDESETEAQTQDF